MPLLKIDKYNKDLYMYFKEADLPFGGGALSKAWKDMDMLGCIVATSTAASNERSCA